MTRLNRLALVIAVGLSMRAGAQNQRPVFRTGTDVVTIPVAVRASGTNVAGLSATDFVLLDNSVPQTVEVVSSDAVPADVTLIVETSAAVKDYLGSIDAQMRKIASMIRPSDRLEVLGASTYVDELAPLRPAGEQNIPRLRAGGLSSINDALVAALLREPDATRPHLVVALSDTIDTMSVTTPQTVHDVAKYSSSVLTIAWVTMTLDATPQPGESPITSTTSERAAKQHREATVITAPTVTLHGGITAPGTGGMGSNARTEPTTRPWEPHYEPRVGRRLTAFDPLKEAAEMTGGALYVPGVFTDRTASAIFGKLYADYRQRYVLRYTASSRKPGWHDVTVTVPRVPKAQIAAKRGYFVEPR